MELPELAGMVRRDLLPHIGDIGELIIALSCCRKDGVDTLPAVLLSFEGDKLLTSAPSLLEEPDRSSKPPFALAVTSMVGVAAALASAALAASMAALCASLSRRAFKCQSRSSRRSLISLAAIRAAHSSLSNRAGSMVCLTRGAANPLSEFSAETLTDALAERFALAKRQVR